MNLHDEGTGGEVLFLLPLAFLSASAFSFQASFFSSSMSLLSMLLSSLQPLKERVRSLINFLLEVSQGSLWFGEGSFGFVVGMI